jgi:hypothetical protein
MEDPIKALWDALNAQSEMLLERGEQAERVVQLISELVTRVNALEERVSVLEEE